MSSESLITFLDQIRQLLVTNQIQAALDQLQNYLAGTAPRLNNEVFLHAARYHRLSRDYRKGVISREAAQAEQTKLEDDILGLIQQIPKHVSSDMSPIQLNSLATNATELQPETILHINVLKQISWIQRAIEVSKSVCRVLTPRGLATGFLIAADLLITNNHVISDPHIANESYAEFNYEQDLSGKFLQTYRYRLDSRIFHTSPSGKLDYTIVGIKQDLELPPLNTWGHLDLNPFADPVPSEHVVIIQHPNGGLKQIALTANQVVRIERPYLLYSTDTMAGSSGAPVFNDVWQVIAIHHAGVSQNTVRGFTNEGVLMSAIKPDAASYWPS